MHTKPVFDSRSVVVFPNHAASIIEGKPHFESAEASLVRGLHERLGKHTFACLTHIKSNSSHFPELSPECAAFVSLGQINVEWSAVRKFVAWPTYISRILRLIRASRFCYIFVPGNIGIIVGLLCLCMRKPYGVYYRGIWSEERGRLYRLIKRLVMSNASFALTTGETLRLDARRFSKNVDEVVPMAPMLFEEFEDVESTSDTSLSILFVGRIVKEKGVFELLDAFDEVCKQLDHVVVSLCFIGDGGDIVQLKSKASDSIFHRHITIVGPITDHKELAKYYQRCDIFCLPTYSEGFPRCIYEASKFRCPILTTPVGAIPSVIKNEFNGIFCETRNTIDLTNKLLRMVCDAELRHQLASNAFETFCSLMRKWRSEGSHGTQVAKRIKSYLCDSDSIR